MHYFKEKYRGERALRTILYNILRRSYRFYSVKQNTVDTMPVVCSRQHAASYYIIIIIIIIIYIIVSDVTSSTPLKYYRRIE